MVIYGKHDGVTRMEVLSFVVHPRMLSLLRRCTK